MKKYVNLLLILVISIVVPTQIVNAAKPKVDYDAVHNAETIGGTSSSGTTVNILNIENLLNGGSATRKNYTDSVIKVSFAGEEYDAYCLDPQIPRPSGKMKCEPMNANPASQYIVNRAFGEDGFNSGYNHEKVLLAYRFLSVMQGVSFGGDDAELSTIKTGLEYYVKLRDYSQENNAFVAEVKSMFENAGLCGEGEGKVNCDNRYAMANYIVKSDVSITDENDILFDAYWLARSAYNHGNYGSVADEDQQGSLVFEYWEAFSHDNHVEYRITSDAEINREDLEFVCDKCESEPYFYWNGGYGWVELDIKPGECEYDLEVYYPIKGGYVCESTADGNYQSLFINIQEEVVGLAQILSGYSNSEECGGGCCRKNPKIKPDYITGSVNNCCNTSTHSEATQYQLNDLFCEDEDLDVKYYWKKCNSEGYMHNEAPVNDFCEVYCTERVSVDLPGAITAVSGRYFTLTKNPVGNTTSAYIQGYKRCRVWIDYYEFERQYKQAVYDEINAYNDVQKYRAIEKMYDSASPPPTSQGTTITSHVSASASGSCEYDCHDVCSPPSEEGGEPDCHEECSTESHSGSANGNVTFYLWRFSNTRQDYYRVQIDLTKHTNKYEKLTIKHGYKSYETRKTYSFDEYWDAISDANDIVSEAEADCDSKFTHCSGGCSGSRNNIRYEGQDHTDENVPEAYQNLQNKIVDAVEIYNGTVREATAIEEDLFTCTDYFEAGNPGSNARAMYQFKASQTFKYSQTYLDEKAELKSDTIQAFFKTTPGCRITGPTIGAEGIGLEGEIIEPQYTSIYSPDEATKKYESMIDFEETTVDEMELQTSERGFEQFLAEEFQAEKHATIDGRYRAVCEWEEDQNRFYTLVHSGFTQRSSAAHNNKTIHERQYQVYLTTLEGTYETFWDIKGLGSEKNGKGLFDDFFYAQKKTCAGERPRDITMFTCTVKVEHEVVLTGYCNGVVNGTHNCDPFKEGYELVNFKVVNPSDLFPSVNDPAQVPSYNGETYGYNWVVDPEGQEVLGKIQEKGQEDSTYAPENLSYSFKLTPQDMAAIKDYNTQQVENNKGGYSDFTLNCDCPSGPIPANSTVSCGKCKSPFVENLANGKVVYTHGQANVSGWSGIESLGTVRNGNNW